MYQRPDAIAMGCRPHHPGCDAVHRGLCDHRVCGQYPQTLGVVLGCGGGPWRSWSLTATRAHPLLCCCCHQHHHPPVAAAVADHHHARGYVAGGSDHRQHRTARRWRDGARPQAHPARRQGLAGVGNAARGLTRATAGSHARCFPGSRGSATRSANGSEMMVGKGRGSWTGCGCGGRGSRRSSRVK